MSIDEFDVEQVCDALRAIEWTPKARTLLLALASAPDRALSRRELARTIGSESPQAATSALGHFGRALARQLDPRLLDEWKPANGRSGDWVVFLSWNPSRWTSETIPNDDSWVFVMRETLARALAAIGEAVYHPLSPNAQAAVRVCAGMSEQNNGEGGDSNGEVVVSSVPVELMHVERFDITPTIQTIEAERGEQRLVLHFQEHLIGLAHTVVRHRYELPDAVLYCDLYDATDRILYVFPRGLSDGFVNRVADGHRWSGVGGHEG